MSKINMPDGTIINITEHGIFKKWGSQVLGSMTPDELVNKFRELDSIKKSCYPEETPWVYQPVTQ